jgi:hypothetical protein
MRLLRLVGLILFAVGLALLFIWGYEEFINNFNYYYHHQVNFDLLILFGVLLFVTGLWLMNWERKPKTQNSSLDSPVHLMLLRIEEPKGYLLIQSYLAGELLWLFGRAK